MDFCTFLFAFEVSASLHYFFFIIYCNKKCNDAQYAVWLKYQDNKQSYQYILGQYRYSSIILQYIDVLPKERMYFAHTQSYQYYTRGENQRTLSSAPSVPPRVSKCVSQSCFVPSNRVLIPSACRHVAEPGGSCEISPRFDLGAQIRQSPASLPRNQCTVLMTSTLQCTA